MIPIWHEFGIDHIPCTLDLSICRLGRLTHSPETAPMLYSQIQKPVGWVLSILTESQQEENSIIHSHCYVIGSISKLGYGSKAA